LINIKRRLSFLDYIVFIITILALLPLIIFFLEGIQSFLRDGINFGSQGYDDINGTIKLVLYTSIIGSSLGITNGWLLSACKFPWKNKLKLAQLIPLATPAYLITAITIDLGSIFGITISGMPWAVIILAITTYPYVFILSTESFSKYGTNQLEACRSLGIGPWKSFFRVALPMALPAIGAGVALMGMEVINEFGAVQMLNIQTLSAGIYENWVLQGNPSGAIGLSLIALISVFTLISIEKYSRRKGRRWTDDPSGEKTQKWELKGIKSIIAILFCLFPPLFALGTIFFWIFINLDRIPTELNSDLILITSRTLLLGLITALIAVSASLILSVIKRWNKSFLMKALTFSAGIGYAIPGTVFAISLLSLGNFGVSIFPIALLIWGYSDRFLAVSKSTLDSAFERISSSFDEAASGLGQSKSTVIKKIHLPLLKGPLIVSSLLVFVDTIKELPLTFILRPFDFDTLSVRVFQYAGDERMGDAILPALIITILGLIASLSLIPALDNRTRN
tara:strand:- start:834 stop:2357 length:1524 start_codon:yes stop_codon:yes gene_type:complete